MQTIDRRRFNTGLFLGSGLGGCAQVPTGAPDLIVTGLRWSEDDGATWHTGPIQAGSNVWFEADVKNQGTGPTPDGVIVGVAFRANGTMVAWSDNYTTALPAGQTISLRANGGPDGDKYWNNVQAGSYTIRAHVDDVNRIPNELDKTNNTLDIPVTVQAGGGYFIGFQTGRAATKDTTTYWRKMVDAQQDMGISTIRFGLDGLGGKSVGASFNWGPTDTQVAYLRSRGVILHGVVDPRVHCEFFSDTTTWQRLPEPTWRANWRYFLQNVVARYRGDIRYYIILNEPDIAATAMTDDEVLKATQDAWNDVKAIDAGILVEGPPAGRQDSLVDWLALGIADYCDIIGTHEYGGGYRDSNMDNVSNFLAAAGVAKPRSISESGYSRAWNSQFGNWSGDEGRISWYRAVHTIYPMWGINHVLLFAYDHGEDWSVISSTSTDPMTKYQPLWNVIKTEVIPKHGLLNGGFESAVNATPSAPAGTYNKDWPWLIMHESTEGPNPIEWQRCHFISGDAANARTGSGYLKMEVGQTTRTLYARQAIWGLTPSLPYEITAYAFITGIGTATLSARGYDPLNGNAITSQATSTTGSWRQLRIRFTPVRDWVVIDLRGSGSSGDIRWDDLSIGQVSVA